MLSRCAAGWGRAGLTFGLLVALAAACGGNASTSPTGSATSSPGTATTTLGLPTPGLSTGAPSPSLTVSPVATASSTPAGSTGATPTAATPGPSPTPGSSVAAACTGSADNQAFFAAVAAGVHWTVYCAVLPSGWFFQQGAYDLGSGGQMTVTYRGPAGVHLQLQEGTFCTGGASACSNGSPAGPTAYGGLDGQLSMLSPGYAVYVSPGQPPSWAAASVDLDEATFVRLVAGLHAVAKP